mmetsp:Transcript_7859/g.19532  ORF Transcript_7859/g.19532 Transcript_7859/m.19532 type:complete len:205 (+) Transcript_7859:194-808(+)
MPSLNEPRFDPAGELSALGSLDFARRRFLPVDDFAAERDRPNLGASSSSSSGSILKPTPSVVLSIAFSSLGSVLKVTPSADFTARFILRFLLEPSRLPIPFEDLSRFNAGPALPSSVFKLASPSVTFPSPKVTFPPRPPTLARKAFPELSRVSPPELVVSLSRPFLFESLRNSVYSSACEFPRELIRLFFSAELGLSCSKIIHL